MPTTSRFSPCRQMMSDSLHAGILHMRGNDRQIVGIERNQFELGRHRLQSSRPQSLMRSIEAPQADSFSSSRSKPRSR